MIDVILLTTGKRTDLAAQSLHSLIENRSNVCELSLTVVVDGNGIHADMPMPTNYTCIFCAGRPGASTCRNIGASSIPRYRRQKYVMFLDDDVYMCPNWDEKLIELANAAPRRIVSGHAHPYNGSERRIAAFPAVLADIPIDYQEPLVISTVHMLMPWALWDDVGFFCEPGGPGGSEDYDYCMRAKAKGYHFAITQPQCILHCGLTSSSGKHIVGYEEMVRQNNALVQLYRLQGKVKWA